MAALKSLVEAFLHWHEEEHMPRFTDEEYAISTLQHGVRRAAHVLGLEIEDDRSVPTPPAVAFLSSLPLLEPHDLPLSERECFVCSSTMHAEDHWLYDYRLEVATRLPCGHVMGYKCLEKWLNPMRGANNNTCPYCRAVCFEKMAGDDTVEGTQQRLDLLEWGHGIFHRVPDSVERAKLEWYRMKIVGYWLDEVLLETEQERVELEREITGQVAVELTIVSKRFSRRLMEFDTKSTLVDIIKLQMRCRQLTIERYHGLVSMEVGDLGAIGEDDDVHSGGVDDLESGGEVDELEESEITDNEEERDDMEG